MPPSVVAAATAPPQAASAEPPRWHSLSVDDALARFDVGRQGLSRAEAAKRLEVHGPNELQSLGRESAWRIVRRAVPERR